MSAAFFDGANWLNSFDLGFSTAGLNLALDSVRVTIEAENLRDSVSVVSMPTVRTVTGENFSFGNVDQVPIASCTITDQSETVTFTYRDVGLQFSGIVSVIGERYFMNLEQSQGTIVGDGDPEQAPRFREATSKNTLTLALDSWAVVSGLIVDRKQWRRGLLSKREEQLRDLVLVLVRPRTYLSNRPPRAVPVVPVVDAVLSELPWDGSLLPPKPARK
ncbi:hypothetical protein Hhel01_00863 [Haloferula helveola]